MAGGHDRTFVPPRRLRGPLIQTVLASLRLRAMGPNPMLHASREVIIDAGDGVRLQGFHSPRPDHTSKGMVILLHGWEGSAGSTYILHTGRFLFGRGYDIFRLNFRDHGETHHLNEGIFYGTLLREVLQGVVRASVLSDRGPVFLMGFSLGGNFALRIARAFREGLRHPISHVTAISPVLDPAKATDAIDAQPFLRWYFMKKWKRSLRKNQELYPGLYDFKHMLGMETIRAMTDALIAQSGLYADAKEYFAEYTVGGDFLEDVAVPLTIVTSSDDPAIPVDDFHRLSLSPRSRLVIHRYGGHNGFLQGVWAPAWYEHEAAATFALTRPV